MSPQNATSQSVKKALGTTKTVIDVASVLNDFSQGKERFKSPFNFVGTTIDLYFIGSAKATRKTVKTK